MNQFGEKIADRAEKYRQAKAQLDAARIDLVAEIRAATAAGMKQADIVRASGHVWTREQVRKIQNVAE